jgi:hypothetical protein
MTEEILREFLENGEERDEAAGDHHLPGVLSMEEMSPVEVSGRRRAYFSHRTSIPDWNRLSEPSGPDDHLFYGRLDDLHDLENSPL